MNETYINVSGSEALIERLIMSKKDFSAISTKALTQLLADCVAPEQNPDGSPRPWSWRTHGT
jgi:hypothetical protein